MALPAAHARLREMIIERGNRICYAIVGNYALLGCTDGTNAHGVDKCALISM